MLCILFNNKFDTILVTLYKRNKNFYIFYLQNNLILCFNLEFNFLSIPDITCEHIFIYNYIKILSCLHMLI
jgi:hypothetical protein